jgi:hypothetical protein
MSAPQQRSFACPACQVQIFIPTDLPPTSAPCPRCGTTVTSPALQPAPVALEPLPARIPEPRSTPIPAPVPRTASTKKPADDTRPPSTSSATPWIVSAALLLMVIAGSWWFYGKFIKPESSPVPISKQPAPPKTTAVSTEFTWEGEARHVLRSFFQAQSAEAKARWVIGGKATVERLHALWGERLFAEDPVDPNDFAAILTGEEKSDPPIYLLLYDRPVQMDIKKYLRPLVSMEVMQGTEPLDPLTKTLTEPENFEMPPLKIEAYFKQTTDGLRLDYDLYLQTRHRTLYTFAESAPVAASAVFRVIIIEDVPLFAEKKNQRRVYRITDPIHIDDSYRITTALDSPASKQLSEIHWYGMSGVKSQFAAATVRVSKQAGGEIHLEDLICWDFDGLAGAPGLPWRGAVSAPTEAEEPPSSESKPSLTDP